MNSQAVVVCVAGRGKQLILKMVINGYKYGIKWLLLDGYQILIKKMVINGYYSSMLGAAVEVT